MTDPYKALGVKSSANSTEIKKAYRNLAKKYHPDRTGGDRSKEKRFKEISAAYEILSDPEKRSRFDNMNQMGGIPLEGDLSDLFSQMFGGAASSRGGRPSSRGGSPFGGMGGGSPFGGMGGGSPFGGGGRPRPQQATRPVKKAAPKEKKIKASDGSILVQRGNHVYSDLRVIFHEAMQGTVAHVPTVSSVAKVRVPAGTSSGQKLRLKGKGARISNSTVGKGKVTPTHGDHFVTVHIDVPKVEGSQSSDLLVKLVTSLEKDKGQS